MLLSLLFIFVSFKPGSRSTADFAYVALSDKPYFHFLASRARYNSASSRGLLPRLLPLSVICRIIFFIPINPSGSDKCRASTCSINQVCAANASSTNFKFSAPNSSIVAYGLSRFTSRGNKIASFTLSNPSSC